MNKHDFDKYSKEEIVNILIKYQVDYNSQGILNDLYRCRKYNEEKLIEKNNNDYSLFLKEYIEFRKELFLKYDTYDRKIYTKNDLKKLKEYEEKESKLEY